MQAFKCTKLFLQIYLAPNVKLYGIVLCLVNDTRKNVFLKENTFTSFRSTPFAFSGQRLVKVSPATLFRRLRTNRSFLIQKIIAKPWPEGESIYLYMPWYKTCIVLQAFHTFHILLDLSDWWFQAANSFSDSFPEKD